MDTCSLGNTSHCIDITIAVLDESLRLGSRVYPLIIAFGLIRAIVYN